MTPPLISVSCIFYRMNNYLSGWNSLFPSYLRYLHNASNYHNISLVSEPIRCFYCFGPANNSTCADPVDPREDKNKALQVIECESGICLKWTHVYNSMFFYILISSFSDWFTISINLYNQLCLSLVILIKWTFSSI